MSFAEAKGASRGLADEQSRLQTKELDAALMASWMEAGRSRARGYSLVPFDGVCPDEWLEQFTAVVRVMNSAPRSDPSEDVEMTAEQVRANQEESSLRGDWRWTVCAKQQSSGDLVGFTELGGMVFRPWLAEQGDTGVDPSHRNLGLGRWLKAANALRLLEERPQVAVVETWNAGVNSSMLSINHQMGYRLVAHWQEWILKI
jgi:hypothetical protein